MTLRHATLFIAVPALALLTACAARIAPIPPIASTYSFANIESREDQVQISRTIAKYGTNVHQSGGDAVNPVYEFTLEKVALIEQLHAELAFVGKANSKNMGQMLNVLDPTFGIRYSTTNISGSVETIVRFSVTPGSTLEVKEANGDYAPREVDTKGQVQFNVKIRRDQLYIYGRTRLAAVCKEIRIKIETGTVENLGLCK